MTATAKGCRSAGTWLAGGRAARAVFADAGFGWAADGILGPPAPVVCGLALGLTVGIGLLDVMVGRLPLSALYLIPVAIATAAAGRAGGFVVATAAVAAWASDEAMTTSGSGLVLAVSSGTILLLFASVVLLLAALNDALGQLEQSNAHLAATMTSLREFVAMAAHDLRGPQTALQTAAGLLSSPAADSADVAPLLGVIERQTAHLGRLTEDLFLLSVADTGRLEVHPDTVEIAPLLRAAAAESGGSAVTVEAGTELRVHADPTHVQRIVANLVRNAFRHGAPPVRVQAITVGDEVEVTVTDAGPGVPAEFVPRLFHRFARGGGAEGGAGLGLAIVAELAQANGGSVCYRRPTEDEVDGGATFAVRFPAA